MAKHMELHATLMGQILQVCARSDGHGFVQSSFAHISLILSFIHGRILIPFFTNR